MNRHSLVLIVVGILLAGVVIYFTRIADYPPTEALLSVQAGSARIVRSTNGQPETVDAGKEATISPGDKIQMNGQGRLIFAGAQADLTGGTVVDLIRYGSGGGEGQIIVALSAGQLSQRVIAFADRRSFYELRGPGASIITRGADFVAHIGNDQGLQVGVAAGQANVTAQNRTVSLVDNQGVAILSGQPPGDLLAWSRVRVATYRPDGTTVVLPVTLTNTATNERYEFSSLQLFAVPEGDYSITISALKPYQIDVMSLKSGPLHELPVTFAEIEFTTLDEASKPVAYTALTVQGDITERATPNTGVLISPGKWTIMVAREEKPNAIQPIDVEVFPGQHHVVSLRNNLFGGGSVAVAVTAPNGSPAESVKVAVFLSGAEDGQPLLIFRSNSPPQPLPEGNYVISVLTPIAYRKEVTIRQNQTESVRVELGTLTVNYTDTQGRPANRTVFIASSDNMKRLGQNIVQMRQTPYGVAIGTGRSVIVPEGTYDVVVDDTKDVSQDAVRVDARQVVTIDLRAAQ